MPAAQTNSIRKNFMVVVLATTFAALLIAATALLVYEARLYRHTNLDNLRTQAELVAKTVAPALVFDDLSAAQDNLDLLRHRKDIEAAVLYTPAGALFAAYLRAGSSEGVSMPDWEGTRIEAGKIVAVQRIVENGMLVGTLYLRAQYQLWNRLYDYLIILASVMAGSLVLALLLSTVLQRSVTEPIVALTKAAHNVVNERDFSLRVPKSTGGEIGVLVDAFNTMLAEVGQRAGELEASNQVLLQESSDRAAAEAALRVADRRKDEFLAILAHELRNPLAPITNALAILHRAPLDAKLVQLREMMERQLRQLVRLVDDLLDVSRITTGKLVLRRDVVDLLELVRNAADTVKPLLDSRSHRLTLDLPTEPILMHADGVRLSQVISNLLNNAAKYTEPGGRIEVAVARDDNEVSVRVTDSGIGITAEMLTQVFEMFRQADSSPERIQSGLGVGLTLAKRLVELHQGSITATSLGLGMGSEFVVRLPIMQMSAAAEERTPTLHDRLGSGPRRVMVVDDNVDFAETLATLVRQLGHDVLVAHSGAEALAQAPRFAPDFAFLDIGMPGMNGYELAQRLRALPETAQTVLVSATGYDQETDRKRAAAAGFDRHLVKPVELRTVETILATFSAEAVRQYDFGGKP
jgi:signal transduction histidine kinase/ActR/RegA family two-component response regulator